MITKCLNRITTETEISAAHACHFLLGYSDSKTSHKFTRLNLHTALAWLTSEMKKNDSDLNEVPMNEGDENFEDDNSLNNIDDNETTNNNKDNVDEDEDEEDAENMYSVSIGNTGFVVVNQMIDYLNRGEELADMCLYEYAEKVYKMKIKKDEVEKNA